MSSDAVIKVNDLSKCYQIYDHPRDRLKQFVFPKFGKFAHQLNRNYYHEFWALKDINFEVKRGESVGILGRNGSGKSTLLQIICGTLSPTTGTVQTSGRIAALLELGAGFNPEFTGRENVYLNGSLLGLNKSQIDERFDEIAAFADIGEHLNQPIKTYSSGMVVRLAFAVQVQVEPDILIVDEALAVGDWLFQKRCFQRIEKLISDGTTLLFVSHDQESVRTLTNRALLLNRGASVAWGSSSEVVLEYRRLLHIEEAAYFADLTKHISESQQSRGQEVEKLPDELSQPAPDQISAKTLRSEQLSFGDQEVHIESVEIIDNHNQHCTIFYPGDEIRIRVKCRTLVDINQLNVAVRLRNKEGIKIYSWGTLNQDMVRLKSNSPDSIFWQRSFSPNNSFYVEFSCPCNLGMNLYEVQASVSYEATPDYLNQRILHWRDEAAFFQVLIKNDEYFFGGAVDLQMLASWNDGFRK